LIFPARDADEREKWIQGLENAILSHSNALKVGLYILVNTCIYCFICLWVIGVHDIIS